MESALDRPAGVTPGRTLLGSWRWQLGKRIGALSSAGRDWQYQFNDGMKTLFQDATFRSQAKLGRVHCILQFSPEEPGPGTWSSIDITHNSYTTTTLYITYFDSSHIYTHMLVRGDQHLSSVYWILASILASNEPTWCPRGLRKTLLSIITSSLCECVNDRCPPSEIYASDLMK